MKDPKKKKKKSAIFWKVWEHNCNYLFILQLLPKKRDKFITWTIWSNLEFWHLYILHPLISRASAPIKKAQAPYCERDVSLHVNEVVPLAWFSNLYLEQYECFLLKKKNKKWILYCNTCIGSIPLKFHWPNDKFHQPGY